MDQPKHDSQCLLEKQCGINMKSLQKVKEDGWPSRPLDIWHWCQAADCPLQST